MYFIDHFRIWVSKVVQITRSFVFFLKWIYTVLSYQVKDLFFWVCFFSKFVKVVCLFVMLVIVIFDILFKLSNKSITRDCGCLI